MWISGWKKPSVDARKSGPLLASMKTGDILYITELSRLDRSLIEIMAILHQCMEKDARVYAIKEGHQLGNNINSKALAFAFWLSAEIERQLISQQTREALERKKTEGMKLGRPEGSLNKEVKLTGKEDAIRELLKSKVSHSAIARILGVDRQTATSFIKSRKLQ